MFLVLLIVSLPFLWFGMSMTLLRLRESGSSAGWAALFFIPLLNVLLFVALCIVPRDEGRPGRDLSAVMESALFAVVTTAALATIAVGLATKGLETYGLGLFVAVPFCVGYLSAFLHARRHPDAPVQSYVVALLATFLLGGFLMALAWEGVICVLMAAPLGIVVAMIGAACGSRSARRGPRQKSAAPAYLSVAILPLLLLAEADARRTAPLYRVDSEIVIDAAPETVWKNVVSFSEITGEPEWYFRAGIAYPLRARIHGRGVGATRRCEFTTGTFVEPIEVWNEPRLLRFGVTANPPPMRELSPLRPDRRAASARLSRFAARAVRAPGAAGRAHSTDRNDVVPASSLAGAVLAFLVGRHHPSHPLARAAAYPSVERSLTPSVLRPRASGGERAEGG
jgi:hypothetical protein